MPPQGPSPGTKAPLEAQRPGFRIVPNSVRLLPLIRGFAPHAAPHRDASTNLRPLRIRTAYHGAMTEITLTAPASTILLSAAAEAVDR